jgi:hypothetical protein
MARPGGVSKKSLRKTERGAYVLHLNKSKKGKGNEKWTVIEGRKGEEVIEIEELCDNIYSFQSKANFTAR